LKKASKLRLAGATAAVVALVVVAVGGTASAGAAPEKGVPTVIKIKGNDNPHFVAPDTVPAGSELEIENLTKPNKIGPHTFSLVTKDQLPRGKEEFKKCENGKLICADIIEAHDVDFSQRPPIVHEPIVENGDTGWDESFDGTDPGDSFYTETKDETHSRTVQAQAGNTFRFMCVVHPFMRGKIDVVSP
jgi:hypothetical protein